MPIAADTFILAANAELEQDAYHNVRRSEDGGIEMIDESGRHVVAFSAAVTIDDLVSVSVVISQLWQEGFSAGERDALKQIRAQIETLKAAHGARLTAAQIEAAIKEREDWYAMLDREDAEEAAALDA